MSNETTNTLKNLKNSAQKVGLMKTPFCPFATWTVISTRSSTGSRVIRCGSKPSEGIINREY